MKTVPPTSPLAAREEERRRLERVLEGKLGQSLNLLLAQANAYHAALPRSATKPDRRPTCWSRCPPVPWPISMTWWPV